MSVDLPSRRPGLHALLCLLPITLGLPAKADQFSIECQRIGAWNYLTFDDQTKRVVVEFVSRRGDAPSNAWKGLIGSITVDNIQFELLNHGRNLPNIPLFWGRRSGTISMPHSSSPWPEASKCVSTDLRPSLSLYDRITPIKE
jgi:hypothetical protein